MAGVKIPKPKPAKQPCWRQEEVRTILAAAPENIRAPLLLLSKTGLRFGELGWLTWADIDLKANLLRIQPKAGWKPKTGDQRAMPLSPSARDLLESLPRRWEWVLTMPPTPTNPEPGRQWTERRLLSALKRVLRHVGLVGKLHTFRHSFISRALLSGIPVSVVRSWVGHVDPYVIDLYTHVFDSASQEAMAKLARTDKPDEVP